MIAMTQADTITAFPMIQRKYPIQIDKKWICKAVGLTESRELRSTGIFSDNWLIILDIPLEAYRKRRRFTIIESRRIIAMLEERKFIIH